MSTEYKRTPGGAILMDGNNLRDETVARLRKEIEAAENLYRDMREGRQGNRKLFKGVLVRTGLMRWASLSQTASVVWRLGAAAAVSAGLVVAAGAAWSNMSGNDTALAYATIVKLTRTLMIVPITLVLAIFTARNARKNQESEKSFSIASVFPWFVLWFLVTALLNTFLKLGAVSDIFVVAGKYMIVMAMVAIGLNTDLKKLIKNGFKPIFLGVCCWSAVAIASLVVQRIIGIW